MVAERRILIVEDDAIVQMHLGLIVNELGHVVSGVASSAQEALTATAASPPHLVLMDIRLSGDRDGIEVARELRARHDLAVVFVTAYADEETVRRAQDIGAVGYVVKPFSKPQLRAALSTAFTEHRRQRRSHKSEQALASIVGGRGDAVIVTDNDGMVTFIDSLAAALTGWSQHQALDRHVLEVLRASVPPDFAARWSAWLPEEGAPLEPAGLDLALRDASGRRFQAEILPLTDSDGERHGMAFVFRDDSARSPLETGRAPGELRPFGAGTRMAIFSHDTLGLGHLQRSLNISRALTARFPGLSILLLTGSPAVHRYPLPRGVDYVKLPAVRKVAPERYEARSLGLSDAGVLRLRSNILLRSLQDYDPHVLLVDHSPVGMKGELLPALEWLHRHRPTCTKLLGLRDILDDPEVVTALWQKQGIYEVLRRLYDHILIYGSPDVFDTASAYRFPPDVRAKTFYCNYVAEFGPAVEQGATEPVASPGKPQVVVTIGGGDGGEFLIGTYLEMLRRSPEVDFETLLITGPFLPPERVSRFREEARGLPASLLEFVPSTSPYLERADLVVCTGGYNTVVQTLRFGKRALVIPRVLHRTEQLIRARRLAEMRLVTLLHPSEATPGRLRESVEALLADPARPLAEARAGARIRFDGTARLGDLCARLAVEISGAD